MNGWHYDKRLGDRLLPEIKAILGQQFIGEPPIEEDQLHNTDLITLYMRPLRFACRIRRHVYLPNYAHQFTMRSSRFSGNKTELQKVLEGWGDYLVYGFADQTEQHIFALMIGDLSVFRHWYYAETCKHRGIAPGVEKWNYDFSSTFRVFDTFSLPRNFLVDYKVIA